MKICHITLKLSYQKVQNTLCDFKRHIIYYTLGNGVTRGRHENTKRRRNLSLFVAAAQQPNGLYVKVQGWDNLTTWANS